MPKRPGNWFSSGELAAVAGVSRDALRYYERRGLLPVAQRSQNGYRQYPPQALDRVRVVRAALGIGFTVEELSEVLTARDRGQAPCQRVHILAMEKAQALELRIAELTGLHKTLRATIKSWGRKLNSSKPGKRLGLLEAFVANHPESARAVSPLISPGLKRRLESKSKEDKIK
jgi:MerR family transcriptional regulator, copper efflux regulator